MPQRLALAALSLAALLLSPGDLWSQVPSAVRAADTDLASVAELAQYDQVALHMLGILVAGFLVFFMQVGFALVETGMVRAKNVAHTMAMNLLVYCLGGLGFWACGFAFMFGNYGALESLGGGTPLTREVGITLGGHFFGLLGRDGFFLAGRTLDAGLLALYLFQMMFMDTAATIPTGALAERWKLASFLLLGLFMSMVLYPVYGNWVWGHGWLARLGAEFGLGHGHVDYAGSSVVHMVGGLTALVGAYVLGPRIGKYRPDGAPNPVPAHNVPMYMAGTLILAFGWFGFNTGSSLAAADLNSARIAVNTLLASAAGSVCSLAYMWLVYGKPDPSFLCNGLLAGLVSITASCAFVSPSVAVLIGGIAGAVVVWGCLFIERRLRVDDPVGAIAVHGLGGIWGILALGLFADGTHGVGYNHSHWYRLGDGRLQWFAERLTPEQLRDLPGALEVGVTGLFYGNPSQLLAECVGLAANLLWVLPVAYAFFRIVDRWIGNRVSPQTELVGLDVPELGALGYVNQDPKVPESRTVVQVPAEPRAASVPPNGAKRFTVLVEGVDLEVLTKTWSDLCQTGRQPAPPEFRVIYPYMTTMKENRFNFRGGDPELMRKNLEQLLQNRVAGQGTVRARLEAEAPHTT